MATQATNLFNLGGPPRLTGDANADMAGLIEWVWAFYNASIISNGLLQTGQLPEQMQDQFPILYSLGNLTGTDADKIPYFSAPETFTITDYTSFARQWDALADDIAARALLGITAYTDEQVRDVVGALVRNGTGITWVYDDGADTLTPTVTITQYTDELAQDAIGTILLDSTTIDFTYDDATPTITAIVKDNSLVAGKATFTATDKLLGRSTAGAGAGEEIACTAAGRAILDDAAASDQRTTLGLGTIATENAGISTTITTAKLTALGANGSMTFVNGILTAETPAT